MKSQSFPVKFVDNQTNLSQFKDKINRTSVVRYTTPRRDGEKFKLNFHPLLLNQSQKIILIILLLE